MTTSASPLINLAAGRTIVIQQKGHAYTFKLRRIEEKDWLRYFAAIVSTSEQKGREVTRETDATSAGLELLETVLESVDGYRLPAGVSGFSEASDRSWISQIPMGHRLGVLDVLMDVRLAEDEDDELPLTLGTETVALEVLWTANADGHMTRVRTVHEFRPPSAEQTRSYMRESSRARVVGGARSGKTIYTGAQKSLCGIYDELIVSVAGYAINGEELGPNAAAEKIAQWMDARHKVEAASRLFASVETEG